MCGFSHPNIVHLIGVVKPISSLSEPYVNEPGFLYRVVFWLVKRVLMNNINFLTLFISIKKQSGMVMEMLSGGSLYEQINGIGIAVPKCFEEITQVFFQKISSYLSLHSSPTSGNWRVSGEIDDV